MLLGLSNLGGRNGQGMWQALRRKVIACIYGFGGLAGGNMYMGG
jgi:hypothetical protein